MKEENSYDELILKCVEDLKIIKQNQKKLINEKNLSKIDSNKKTSSKFKKLETEILKLQIKHFEMFMKLIIEIRNLGSQKNGYKKRHFINEFQSYMEAKNRLKN